MGSVWVCVPAGAAKGARHMYSRYQMADHMAARSCVRDGVADVWTLTLRDGGAGAWSAASAGGDGCAGAESRCSGW